MPRSLRLILVALLLVIAVVWWALSATSGPPSAPDSASATPGMSVPSAAQAPAVALGARHDSGEAEDARAEALSEEEEPEATGPCIALEVTARGVPVAGANVTAALHRDERSYLVMDPLALGPDGKGLGFCTPGTYLLAAHAPGYAPAVLELTEPDAGTPPLARFQLTPGGSVSGHVLDKDSQEPIAGAQLTFSASEGFAVEGAAVVLDTVSLTSDAQGAFHTADLAAGTYRLSVDAPGHSSKELNVRAPRAEHLSVELEGTSRLEGQVVDSAGAPVPGANVWVSAQGSIPSESGPLTDAQGRFSLEVQAGTYSLGASSGGQVGSHDGAVSVARGGLVDGLVIRLGASGTLSGRVFMRSSREPVTDVALSVRNVDVGWSEGLQTKADGTFRLEHLLPGEYELTVFHGAMPDLESDKLRIQAGQELSVEIPLVRQATLEGQLTDGLGRPAQNAPVTAVPLDFPSERKRRRTTSDEEGHYTLRGLEPGRYRIEAQCSYATAAIERGMAFQEGETARADFTFPEALGEVNGVAQRADGSLPRYSTVLIATREGSEPLMAGADEKGRFTFKLLPGTYTLTAWYSYAEVQGPEQRVTVEPGKVVRVRLTVPDSVTETTGIVLNSRGEPAAGAYVTFSGDEVSASEEADAQGRFSLKSATDAGGTGTVHAESDAEEGETRGVKVGSRSVVVRLLKAAALRGRVVSTRGPPVKSFDLQTIRRVDGANEVIQGELRPFAGDTFEMVDLPVGQIELLVRTSDGRGGWATVRLAPGQTGTVEISVRELGRVTGRLVRAPGVPMEDWVRLDPETPQERETHTDSNGRFEFADVDPGPHLLDKGTPPTRSFTLHEAETLDLGDMTQEEAQPPP